jgi:hypothetical protein
MLNLCVCQNDVICQLHPVAGPRRLPDVGERLAESTFIRWALWRRYPHRLERLPQVPTGA